MKTQDDWLREAEALLPENKGSLTFDLVPGLTTPGREELILCIYGTIVPASIDSLARWCFSNCDTSPYPVITAPEWSCSWAMYALTTLPMAFDHWSLGGFKVGIFKKPPKPVTRDCWGQIFVLPEIPEHPDPSRGKDKREVELATRVDILALHYFASYLATSETS